jgi:hypothetical protein
MVRGAFSVDSTGASRFDVLLPPCLLIPVLPTILDLRQQLPNSLDIACGPEMDCDAAGRDRLGCRDFLRGDVAAQCRSSQTELLGSVARRKSSHQLHCYR